MQGGGENDLRQVVELCSHMVACLFTCKFVVCSHASVSCGRWWIGTKLRENWGFRTKFKELRCYMSLIRDRSKNGACEYLFMNECLSQCQWMMLAWSRLPGIRAVHEAMHAMSQCQWMIVPRLMHGTARWGLVRRLLAILYLTYAWLILAERVKWVDSGRRFLGATTGEPRRWWWWLFLGAYRFVKRICMILVWCILWIYRWSNRMNSLMSLYR